MKIKFHLKYHCGGRFDALEFGSDRIRTLVSMATDSSHRVIFEKDIVTTLAPSFFYWFFFILAGNEDNH